MWGTPAIENEVLVELARHGETRTWESGVTVVSQGDAADCMYIIHSGELRVYVVGEGGRAVELNTLGAGETFGELMLNGRLRSATVETLARCTLTRVTRAHAERLVKERPDLAFHLIERLVDRVRTLTETVANLGSMDVYQRLVGLCTAQARPHEGRLCVLGMSQQRIAERVGASRAMINRLLQDLTRGGYIQPERGCIVLLRPLPSRW
ncbi:MAG: Crp/Fnr family transcriptional regulator [Proteobacteria bacterium]|nr:Crp/Fnr family transcriptional regulator [Pseudomonadota bacterium]